MLTLTDAPFQVQLAFQDRVFEQFEVFTSLLNSPDVFGFVLFWFFFQVFVQQCVNESPQTFTSVNVPFCDPEVHRRAFVRL